MVSVIFVMIFVIGPMATSRSSHKFCDFRGDFHHGWYGIRGRPHGFPHGLRLVGVHPFGGENAGNGKTSTGELVLRLRRLCLEGTSLWSKEVIQ